MVYLYDTLLNEDRAPYLVQKETLCKEAPAAGSSEMMAAAADKLLSLRNRSEEYLYMFALTSNMDIIGIFELSHGTVNATLASPREAYLKALLCGAANIALIHNHPSGSLLPSKPDLALCKRMGEAGELLGIHLVDFQIVGDGYYSFAENGYIGN